MASSLLCPFSAALALEMLLHQMESKKLESSGIALIFPSLLKFALSYQFGYSQLQKHGALLSIFVRFLGRVKRE